MKDAIIQFGRRALGLRDLAGPIFDKELRVSSRRKRNYALRFVYLAALTLLIGLVWGKVVRESYGSSLYSSSRMSEAGKYIVLCIIWFQFIVGQLISVVLLSTAISDEITHRTLGVLMTTPISSFQIVLGKLLSKMLQLVGLLAISLPLLAVVRVFGGVPWDFVLSALSLTLTSSLVAGSVSMFISIRTRRAYAVILQAFLVGGIAYLLLPLLSALALEKWYGRFSEQTFIAWLAYVNPLARMEILTEIMVRPRYAGWIVSSSWPMTCAVQMGFSLLLLTLITLTVRKVALRQATGEAGTFRSRRKLRKAGAEPAPLREGRIHRVRGPAFVWKELRAPILRSRTRLIVGIVAVLGVLVLTYCLCGTRTLLHSEAHTVYGVIFVLAGILCTAVLSATVITTEKEAQSWPILLCTPLSDWQILVGKAAGILRRSSLVWLLLMGHVLLFCLLGCIHWAALLHVAMLTAWVMIFLTCSGLYFSSRFKRTTTAVMMNLGLGVAIWIALPFVTFMVEEGGRHGGDGFSEWMVSGNPAVQVVVLLEGSSGESWDYNMFSRGYGQVKAQMPLSKLGYQWPGGRADFYETTGKMLLWTLAYILAGIMLLVFARGRLRQKVF